MKKSDVQICTSCNKMKTLSLLLIWLLLSGCAAQYKWSASDKRYAAFAIAGQAADGISTSIAMRKGFREDNSLVYGEFPSDGRIAVVKVIGTAAIICIAHIVPRHRKGILATAGIFGFGFGVKNGFLINR